MKTYDAYFCHDDGLEQCLCLVRGGVPLRRAALKAQSLILNSTKSLELVEKDFSSHLGKREAEHPVIPLCNLRILITALQQAQGLIDAIEAGLEIHEEGVA